MHVRLLQEQQGIKPQSKQPITEIRSTVLEAQLRKNSQFEEVDVVKKGEDTPREAALERNAGNPVITCQALGGKCKEPS